MGDTLESLISRLDDYAKIGVPDPNRVQQLLIEAMSQQGDWLDPKYQELQEGEYCLYPLYRSDARTCSLLSVVLRPGGPVPVHNHGSWAVIGVYRGRERDSWFRRLDNGSITGKAKLELDRTFVNPERTVTIVPDGQIHTVEALDGEVAVSLHVYGTDIVTQERSTFDLKAGIEDVFRPDFADSGK